MKKILSFLFILINLTTFGQVTLLSPTGDGGFETGTTAAANGWTGTNDGNAARNQWIVGSIYAWGGSRGAYITNATGSTPPPNAYTMNATRVAHLYRNFTIPTNAATATLSFYWKGTGETYLGTPTDYMSVYFEPATNAAPVYGTQKALSGTAPTGIVNAATASSAPTTRTRYNLQSTSQLVTINIPASYFTNTAYRLTFEWRNDNSSGTNPPAAIDNVSITYTVASTPPSCASLTAPSNGATGISLSQILSWGSVSSATSYDVYFGTTPTPPYVTNVSTTSYTPTLSMGVTYYWKIIPKNSAGNATGCSTWSFTTISPPSNDLCSNATLLPCATSNLAGTTVNATLKTAPGGGGLASNYGVWYTFTGDGGQTTISVTGSGFDTEMTIVQGTCSSSTLIQSVDVIGGNVTESHTFTTINAATYYVYVAHWSSTGSSTQTGAFTISRTCIPPCTTPTTAGTLSANKTSTTVNDAVLFTTSGNGGSITKFEWSHDNFITVAGTTNNPANPYTLILNVQQPTIWFRTTSVSGTCPAGVTPIISVILQSAPPYIYTTEDGDYISNVTLNTINNNSTYDLPLGDGYQDFTNISTTLIKGSTYTISASSPITFGSTASGYSAWIDFNNNGIFEVSENIMQQPQATTRSQSFTVPSTAELATVTMRVLSVFGQIPSNDAYYSIGYDFGEIEEYKINIQAALPVEMYKFHGVNFGKNNHLFWITNSEQNTSHFNLQKSRDGEYWETISTINASGYSTSKIEYDIIDYDIDPIINYYRLQQYDNDGVYETFGPISINNMDLGEYKTIIKYINLNGQEIDPEKISTMDTYIEVYSDGTMRKIIK